MHAKSDSYTSSCRSAALPYPKHGRRRMLAPMRSSCIFDTLSGTRYDNCGVRTSQRLLQLVPVPMLPSRKMSSVGTNKTDIYMANTVRARSIGDGVSNATNTDTKAEHRQARTVDNTCKEEIKNSNKEETTKRKNRKKERKGTQGGGKEVPKETKENVPVVGSKVTCFWSLPFTVTAITVASIGAYVARRRKRYLNRSRVVEPRAGMPSLSSQ